jgi:hypothetical protein
VKNAQFWKFIKGNMFLWKEKCLGLCGYLKICNFPVKYKSYYLVNSSSPTCDTIFKMGIQEKGSFHLYWSERKASAAHAALHLVGVPLNKRTSKRTPPPPKIKREKKKKKSELSEMARTLIEKFFFFVLFFPATTTTSMTTTSTMVLMMLLKV